jgi:putative transposase
MYHWRKMSEDDRKQALQLRKARALPWHNPPHLDFTVARQYLVSASCYEQVPVIGKTPERMTECEAEVLSSCASLVTRIYAWCILPNHYHLLLKTDRTKEPRCALGRLHGRLSFEWNGADNHRGRKVWYNCFERPMKSERHFWATLNYIHHNPVHHGYERRWQDWPWSSARRYLAQTGWEEAKRI